MTPMVIQLPLDPSGTSQDNLVLGEPHALIANRTFRAIAPFQGAFYTESLKVYNDAGVQLTDGRNGSAEQYYACELYELPSARYGKEICAVIIIKDPAVSNNVTIDYQALGGAYGTNTQAIIQQIEALKLDNRPLKWGDIIGKPSEFPPAKHLHDIGDVYGFEYVVHALDRIRDAIEVGDQASHDAIYTYIDAAIDALSNANAALDARLTAHVNDFNNPHRLKAADINVYEIPAVDSKVATVQSALTAHTSRTDNPHNTTVAQLNTYDGPTIDSKITTAVNAAKLTFTPVQQGGGVSQLTNKVYLGWDGTGLRAQIDATDLGRLYTENAFNTAYQSIQNQLAGKQATGNYAVLGNSAYFGTTSVTGQIYCSGDIWAFNSDERLKHEFRELGGALAKVRRVRGILYRYRPEVIAALRAQGIELHVDLERDYMGFLAQEVQKVAPEIIGPAPFDIGPDGKSISGKNYITIQYDKYCALLNEALKELDEIVEDHGERLQRLESAVVRNH